MIGSAVYSYEGIAIVLPLYDVTTKPELYPRILFIVLTTVFVLYSFFGEFGYFVWGPLQLDNNPLVTMVLPEGWLVYIIKIAFSLNLIITCPLQQYPMNLIIESYIFSNMAKGPQRMWFKNILRTIISGLSIVLTVFIGDTLYYIYTLIMIN